MKLTKYTHACVRLEKDGRVLVLDPGTFSETDQALAGAEAILVTHEHPDHIDMAAVVAAVGGAGGPTVHAPAAVAEKLLAEAPGAAGRIHTVDPGSTFEAAGFAVRDRKSVV